MCYSVERWVSLVSVSQTHHEVGQSSNLVFQCLMKYLSETFLIFFLKIPRKSLICLHTYPLGGRVKISLIDWTSSDPKLKFCNYWVYGI